MEKAAEEFALDLQCRALIRTLETLDELEAFFEGIPGFFQLSGCLRSTRRFQGTERREDVRSIG